MLIIERGVSRLSSTPPLIFFYFLQNKREVTFLLPP
nr:MAG TPA: Golgi reassembly-stacking protein 1, Golgin fold six-stranded anti parallel-barrel.96A [Crassvirales sp.]DAQ48763.1 MAG TPA: Golgi reassembly-stacking protein 1, Golgin fold six-stranded anti parallel-barrel.96A [Caudoviricetes sp.]